MTTPTDYQDEQTKLAGFHAAYEHAQKTLGTVLREYYYGTRPGFIAAVTAAAYAVADLEQTASPRHTEGAPR
jgi:hypothetical protein